MLVNLSDIQNPDGYIYLDDREILDAFYKDLSTVPFAEIAKVHHIPFTRLIELQTALKTALKIDFPTKKDKDKYLEIKKKLTANYPGYMQLYKRKKQQFLYAPQRVLKAVDNIMESIERLPD